MKIAIIGAGVGGISAGHYLRQAGFEDFVILEKAAGIGGTWQRNTYPGLTCDIAAPLYSFSFAPNAEWSGPYPPQPEILAYFEKTVQELGLLPNIRCGVEVTSAQWNEEQVRWHLRLDTEETLEAEVVISAVGMFGEPQWPVIDGLDDFQGTCFHSAQWDHSHDLSGATIGVIGSAASAVQFVPEIVKLAKQVFLFQRTANWVMPKEDTPYSTAQRETFRLDPAAVAAAREEVWSGIDAVGAGAFSQIHADVESVCKEHMQVVENAETRRKLLPDHPWGCKRPLLSNQYYPAFNRDNLELVTESIERITGEGIITASGQARPVDTIVLATGYETTKFASVVDFIGRDGLPLADAWRDGAIAYKGVMTAGFPNLFMLYGPNTNADSLITTIEFEAQYAVRQVERLQQEGLRWIDVHPQAQASYNEKLQQAIAAVTPWHAGCSDYYRGPDGRIVTQWPGRMSELKALLEQADPQDYETGVASAAASHAPG